MEFDVNLVINALTLLSIVAMFLAGVFAGRQVAALFRTLVDRLDNSEPAQAAFRDSFQRLNPEYQRAVLALLRIGDPISEFTAGDLDDRLVDLLLDNVNQAVASDNTKDTVG